MDVKVPEGDVYIHCGDISFRGELDIIRSYCNWVKELPHKSKLQINGNHEVGIRYGSKRDVVLQMFRDAGLSYLENDGIEIDGTYFWGSPITPEFCGWEFMEPRGKGMAKVWEKISEKTNVIICHGSPYGILDQVPTGIPGHKESVGCEELLKRINVLKPLGHLKAVCFGHLHRDNNEPPVEIDGIKFCNASICNNAYQPTNSPIAIDI